MSKVSGSILKLTLDGVTYDVMHDSNFGEVGSAFENTAVPTSGGNMKKMQRRAQIVESVIVAAGGEERVALKSLAERLDNFPISYTTASGDVFRTKGFIEFAKRDTEENRAELKLIPESEWQPFLNA